MPGDANDITSAVCLSVEVAPTALGTHCSHRAGQQDHHIPCLQGGGGGCLLRLSHSHWHAAEKRFLGNGTIANSSYLGKTPFGIPCLRLAERMTVIFKLEL